MNIVSFGGGTNSAALLIGLYKHKIPMDLITFADTGAEHPHTYQFIEIINQWLAEHGIPSPKSLLSMFNTESTFPSFISYFLMPDSPPMLVMRKKLCISLELRFVF